MLFDIWPFIGFVLLFLPIIWFRIDDYRAFGNAPAYEAERARYGNYWTYRALGPRNPSPRVYVAQLVWAILLLPLIILI